MDPKKAVARKNSTHRRNTLEPAQYVSHADLLRIAKKNHCIGIHTEPVVALCRPAEDFWVFRATVYKSARCRGFVGYGDAHPGNVSPLIFNHAELRMARPERSTGPFARLTESPSARSRSCHPGPCRPNKS